MTLLASNLINMHVRYIGKYVRTVISLVIKSYGGEMTPGGITLVFRFEGIWKTY
jgi:hypothetical protein